ncbi:MAG: NAD(P)H-dependent oxidoreductase [Fluviicola sp.]|nr:NAD(P)H-dependent oxidoreductase [Fluviicola sp.]
MNIIAFAASTSKASINKQLVAHTLTHFSESETTLLDLNNYEVPLFSVDLEKEIGHPEAAARFIADLSPADLIIVSMAEHNGNYTAAFKNLFDWCSRIEPKIFKDKPLFLMSTSTGGYGGKNALGAAETRFPRHGAEILETFSLPSFGTNFNAETGITDESLRNELMSKVEAVKLKVN